MRQAVYPKTFDDTWFQTIPPGAEIDWRSALTTSLCGFWLLGTAGPPQNLVRRAIIANGGPGGTATVSGNFGHGSYAASGTPAAVPEFHFGYGSQWSASEGIDMSIPGQLAPERTEAFTIMAWLELDVVRSGGSTNYTIWANNGDTAAFRGIRYQVNWSGTKTCQFLTLANDDTTNRLQVIASNDLTNRPAVLAVRYQGTSLPTGVTFFDGGFDSTTTLTNTLSGTIVPATPLPAIGKRTMSGAAAQPFKGKIGALAMWRGRILLRGEIMEMDLNPQQIVLIPSYRRWSIPAAPASALTGGFRAFQSIWFGPDAGAGIGAPSITAGFRAFQSIWFGPDAGAGGTVTPPTVVGGRKLINQALAATIQAELT